MTELAIDQLDDLLPKIRDFVEQGWMIDETERGSRVADWDEWLARFEDFADVDLPATMTHPVIRRIQRHVRAILAEG